MMRSLGCDAARLGGRDMQSKVGHVARGVRQSLYLLECPEAPCLVCGSQNSQPACAYTCGYSTHALHFRQAAFQVMQMPAGSE